MSTRNLPFVKARRDRSAPNDVLIEYSERLPDGLLAHLESLAFREVVGQKLDDRSLATIVAVVSAELAQLEALGELTWELAERKWVWERSFERSTAN